MAATGRRMATVGAATALLVGAGAGCASESENADLETADTIEFAATPEYVGEVIDASEDTSYRYTMSMSMQFGGDGFDGEIATGAVDGEKMQMRMDMGAMLSQMSGELGEGSDELPPGMSLDDFVIEQVVDGEAVYMRAPFFGAMADEMEAGGGVSGGLGGGEELLEAFASLGDGWGRIDISEMGDVLPGDLQQSLGGQSASPDVFLDMLRSTGDVEELGTDEIDGVEVRGLAAEIDFQDMLEAQGMDSSDVEASPDDELTGMMEAFQMPVEVWIDGDDQIRRITFAFGGDSFAEMAEEMADESGEELPPDEVSEMLDFEMGMTMDFTDYGDDSISIEAPAESTDITDEFLAVSDQIYGD